jgi:hypothetical protein
MTNATIQPITAATDLTTLLYLNPELVAYSNVRTAEDVLSSIDAYSHLPNTMPVLPIGFDHRIFLASQPNVSSLNMAIRDSMMAVGGAAQETLERRAVFVGTLMCPATIIRELSEPDKFEISLLSDIDEGSIRAGDVIRFVQKFNGSVIEGSVESVYYSTRIIVFVCPPNNRMRAILRQAGTQIEAFGIRIYDPLRQARAAFARVNGTISLTSPDVVPAKQFARDMYQLLYPQTRGLDFSDTYLDMRRKEVNNEKIRIRDGDDIGSRGNNNSGGGGGGPGGYVGIINVNDTLIVGPGNFSYISPSNLSLADGYVNITPSSFSAGCNVMYAYSNSYASLCSNLVVSRSNVTISSFLECKQSLDVGQSFSVFNQSDASIGSGVLTISADSNDRVAYIDNVNVRGTIGIGMSNPDISSARMSIAGDIFATGTLITLSDASVKYDIKPIENALDRVLALNGCTYNMTTTDIGDDNRRYTGLIAQDVMSVLPEAVYATDTGKLSVAYGNLVGLLVEAVKELARSSHVRV